MLFPDYLMHKKAAATCVKQSIAYLVSVTPQETGNLPAATDELPPNQHRSIESNELVHWCHGATGRRLFSRFRSSACISFKHPYFSFPTNDPSLVNQSPTVTASGQTAFSKESRVEYDCFYCIRVMTCSRVLRCACIARS